MAFLLRGDGKVLARADGAVLNLLPGGGAPATYALFADVPLPGWVQAGASVPSLSVTLFGGLSCYVQLTRFGVAVGAAVAVSSGAVPSGLPALATPGMYTIRAFADAGLTTQIGESGVVQAWASASGPASAAVTIDASSVPAQPLDGKEYTLTGTAVTSNNYVNVALGYEGSQAEVFPAEVVGGVWSQTRSWHGMGTNTLTVTDPSNGATVQVKTVFPIAQTGEFAPNLWYQNNYYDKPVFTSASADSGYDAGSIGVSVPASWGTLTALTVNPIPAILNTPTNYGNSSFVRQRIDGMPPVPGRYTISALCAFSSHATVTLSLAQWFVPYSQPPTQAKLTLNGPLGDKMPFGTPIGTISNFSAAKGVRYRSQGGTFLVPLDAAAHTYDGTSLVTFADNIPAGPYTFKTRSVEGNVTAWTTHTVTILATTAGTISYTPPLNITNRSPPGTSLGTPTTSLTGTVTWRVRTDRGYRVAIDPVTGALTINRYLSACGNGVDAPGERFDIIATNGTQTATMLGVFVPVAFPVAITAHIGVGQQYATFAAFWAAAMPDAGQTNTAFLNGNIRLFVHPGTYKDDLGTNCSNVYTNLWVTGVRGDGGAMPLITATEPCSFRNGKGYFDDRGMDLIVEGIEFSHARLNTQSSDFRYGICMTDSVDPTQWIGACELRDFVYHDIDDGIGRGQAGTRTYCHNGVMAYGPDGTGYGHGIYALGALLDVRHVTIWGGSNGHGLKSRCDTTIIDNCIFPPLNNGTLGALIDICNGGNATVTNCTMYLGPNSNNSQAIAYAEEIADSDEQMGLGNKLTVANNTVYNLMPTTEMGLYYTAGHQQGLGLANGWHNPPVLIFGLFEPTCAIHDNTFIGFDAGYAVAQSGGYQNAFAPITLGANNTISLTGTIPSGRSYMQPANWPLLTASPGFTDTVVGPTFRPSLDNGRVVGTQWFSAASGAGTIVQEFSASTGVGNVIAYAFTSAKTYENSDQGPFTYALTYTDNAHAGLASVTSSGHLTLGASAAGKAGQIVTIFVNAVSAQTGALNPMGASFWITT